MFRELASVYSFLDKKARLASWALMLLLCLNGPAEVIGIGSVVAFLGVVANPATVQENSYLRFVYNLGWFETASDFVLSLGVIMVFVVAFSNAMLAFSQYALLRIVWGQNTHLIMRLMGSYLRRDYLWYLQQNTASLAKNLLNEVQEVIGWVLKPGLSLVGSVFRVLTISAFLFLVDPAAALLAFGIVGLFFYFLVRFAHRRLAEVGKSRQTSIEGMYKGAQEMLSGLKEIRLAGGEEYLLNSFEESVSSYSESKIRFGVLGSLPKYFAQTLALSGVLIFSIYLLKSRPDSAEVFSVLGIFALGGYRLLSAGQKLYTSYSEMRFGSAAVLRLKEDLYARLEHMSPKKQKVALEDSSDWKTLEVRDLVFSYPGQARPTLASLSLSIGRGQKVAFVGSTGAGKTTLVNMFLGLIFPDGGGIYVDNEPLAPESFPAWRARVGYVPQDIFLLDASVLHNIAFALPEEEIDPQLVRSAAKVAQLHEFVLGELSAGYDTMVGERGVRLSGGQRQRLGIARALYRDPDILVLDEATSALDGATEAAVVASLDKMAMKKTMIVVAHRLQTIRHCDVIHVLRGGRIVASGSFDDLAQNSRDFQKLMAGGEDEPTVVEMKELMSPGADS